MDVKNHHPLTIFPDHTIIFLDSLHFLIDWVLCVLGYDHLTSQSILAKVQNVIM